MLIQRNGQSWLVHTPAKLNLHLEIIGRRDDGYHELETCMVSVDLFDSLRFRPARADLRLVVSPRAAAPADEHNLVLRAATALRQHTGCNQGADIQLVKRIPAQAGLGGGSSDAAATLVALNLLWGLNLPTSELHQLAAGLGSDINFFVERTPMAICRGRGELVEPIDTTRRMDFVVCHPGFGLGTAEVFQQCELPRQPRTVAKFAASLSQSRIALHNRLNDAAVSLRPELNKLRAAFASAIAGPSQLTGSGSAWFGIAPNRRAAVCCARRLHGAGFGRAFPVSTVSGHGAC